MLKSPINSMNVFPILYTDISFTKYYDCNVCNRPFLSSETLTLKMKLSAKPFL